MTGKTTPEELLHLTKKDFGYYVEYYNGVHIGEFETDVDGFYYYWPVRKEGCWSAYVLRAVADKLDELNKPWNDQIMSDPVLNKGAGDE